MLGLCVALFFALGGLALLLPLLLLLAAAAAVGAVGAVVVSPLYVCVLLVVVSVRVLRLSRYLFMAKALNGIEL